MNNLQITSRIKLLCKEKNISIAKLLSDCGFAKSFVYDLEKRDNSPSCDRISKIADCLDCSVDYLLGRTDKPNLETEHTHIEQNHQYIQNDSSPIVFAVPAGNQLDEMQKELLSRFGELSFTEKLEFMQELVKKTEGDE